MSKATKYNPNNTPWGYTASELQNKYATIEDGLGDKHEIKISDVAGVERNRASVKVRYVDSDFDLLDFQNQEDAFYCKVFLQGMMEARKQLQQK